MSDPSTPDLSAILDRANAAAEPTVEAAPAAPAAPAPAEPAAPVVEATPAVDAQTWLAQQTPEVQRHITELRQGEARYRTEAKPFKEAFDGFAPEDVEVLLDVVKTIKADPAEGARQLQELAKVLTPAEVAAIENAAEEQPKYLTADELARVLDEREAAKARAAEQQQVLQSVYAEAAEIDAKYSDPKGFDFKLLAMTAAEQTGGDLHAAHQFLEGLKEVVVADYVAQKGSAATSTAATVPQTGTAPSGEVDVASLNKHELRDALDNFLAQQ